LNEVNPISEYPLVSIVIPCYNQGRFLKEALFSIKNLDYPNTETILIDDGSTDNTAEIAASYPWVKYFFQENQGLPAARNAGVGHSKGQFLIFLDADDWLYPEAISRNLVFLRANPSLAMVSGCHNVTNVNGEITYEVSELVKSKHYVCLLRRNYIGNPAAVLYPRWIIDEFPFDTSPEVKACEDYDQYLKISRKYPVLHHREKISYYRKHDANMSNDSKLMLVSVLNVLKRQKPLLKNEEERQALNVGRKQWTNLYMSLLHKEVSDKGISKLTLADIKTIIHFGGEFSLIVTNYILVRIKKIIKGSVNI
jgi:glycosyltransferase involved in cell wall biosynthesis